MEANSPIFAHQNTKANIDDQVRRQNTWSTNPADYIAGDVGAKYADGNFVPFPFFYDPAFTNHVPPTAEPMLSSCFFSQNGPPDLCSLGHIRLTETDIAVAGGSYSYPTSAAAWDLRRYLWYKLLRHPELADDDADVWAFYNNSQGSSEQRHAGAQYQYEQAFMPAPALSFVLDSLYARHAVLVAEILALDAQIGQDTTNLDETAAAALEGRWTELAALNLAIADALDIYASGRNALLQVVQATVDELPGIQTYESSWGTILSAGIKKSQEMELDTAEIAELLVIAQSCPAEAGTARQVALSYLPIEDAAPYLGRENPGECVEELVVGTPDDDGLLVFPNPTNETVTAYLPDGFGGQYFVFSSAGQLLSYGIVVEGQRVLYLNSAGFDAGMYYLRYASSNGQANTAKYFILK